MRILLMSALLAIAYPSAAANCDNLGALSWLLGQWQMQKGDKTLWENWQKVSDNSFEGHAGSNSSKGQSSEDLRLLVMQGQIFYLAKVSENALPVAFALQDCTENSATFVSAGHDFPQRLHYRLDGQQLHIRVEDLQSKGFTLLFQPR